MKHFIILLTFLPFVLFAQDDLLDEIDQDIDSVSDTYAIFKGLKIVNFESTKLTAKKERRFIVALFLFCNERK